jgi:hypothetical protein
MDFSLPETGNPFPGQFADPDWNCYWTISNSVDGVSHWLLASQYSRMVRSTRDDTHCAARCVLGPPYDPAEAANTPPDYATTNGTLRDPLTHLEWQAYDSAHAGELVSFDEAKSRCQAFGLNGHHDWRLPTVKELSTLVDERANTPAFAKGVAGEQTPYWSSTLHDPTVESDASASQLAWRVSFADGTMVPADDGDEGEPAGLALVRCVRLSNL